EQLKESKTRMAHMTEMLRGIYEEVKEICHRPDVELLQVTTDTWGFDITLCLERANCHIFLYGELRSVNVGCNPQRSSLIIPTSECFLAWGTQTFATGRYYWEVEVGDSWNWALGVCNDYWKKNRNYKMDEVEGLFLLGCVKEGSHCTLFTTSPLVLQYVPRPIGRIGVFLDYEGRAVSFINVAQSSLIHSILSCSFSPHVNPVFCCSHI
ncbi:tripartite motif-containing protein 51-like, partial [Ictidomys tridecemlineatus]